MRVIRWGIVGCGDVTEVKSGPGFQKARGSELVAVMRRDGDKAADYAKRHGVARWYDDADKLIGDKDVDAVYVATPPGTHEFYAMKALAAGKPCYVEKPMTRCASEARRMVEGFKAKGVPLFVAYYRRAMPRFLKVKEILGSGVLGEIGRVEYRFTGGQMKARAETVPWRLVPEDAGGGLFLDLGSHALDLLDFFFGPLTQLKGTARNVSRNYDVEDGVTVSNVWSGSVGLDAVWDFCADERLDEYAFKGSKGELRVSCFGNEPIRVRYGSGRGEEFDIPKPEHVQLPLIQAMVGELLGVGKCASTGESGLRAQEVMDAALVDFYGGREDGFWTRPLK